MIEGVLLLLVGIPGLIANLFNIYLFSTTKLLRTPYGHLTISRCIANAHVILTLVCYVAPANIAAQIIVSEEFASLIGKLPIVSTNSIVAGQLFLVMHRFTAVFFPMFYQTSLCRSSATAIQLFLSWAWGIIGLAFWIIAPMYNGCVFTFDAVAASYGDDCPHEFGLYSISVPIYFCSISVFVVNILISWKLRSLNNKTEHTMSGSKRQSDRRIIRLVIQGIIQDSTFLIDTLVFTFAPVMVESTMEIFVCYSLIWELAHAVDGIIIMFFNAKLPHCKITCHIAPTTSVTKHIQVLSSSEKLAIPPLRLNSFANGGFGFMEEKTTLQ